MNIHLTLNKNLPFHSVQIESIPMNNRQIACVLFLVCPQAFRSRSMFLLWTFNSTAFVRASGTTGLLGKPKTLSGTRSSKQSRSFCLPKVINKKSDVLALGSQSFVVKTSEGAASALALCSFVVHDTSGIIMSVILLVYLLDDVHARCWGDPLSSMHAIVCSFVVHDTS